MVRNHVFHSKLGGAGSGGVCGMQTLSSFHSIKGSWHNSHTCDNCSFFDRKLVFCVIHESPVVVQGTQVSFSFKF